MIYACFRVHTDDDICTVKLVAETIEAYRSHKEYLEKEYGATFTNEFVDDDFGTVVILPEDFRY